MKKVLIADTVAVYIGHAFGGGETVSFANAWIGVLAYTCQIYFDFSGYTDMALGISKMCNINLPINFASPYKSISIVDFWRRWHITLSTFLRDYLYIPLGGNRKGVRRQYINLMLTMLIGGFWHGANWTFIVWGAWQGGLLAFYRWYGVAKGPKLPWLAANLLTMLAAIIGWVVFRAPDLGTAGVFYQGMLGLHGTGISDAIAWQMTPDRTWMIVIGWVVIYLPLLTPIVGGWVVRARESAGALRILGQGGTALSLVAPFCGFLLGMILLYSRAAVPFLYFQF